MAVEDCATAPTASTSSDQDPRPVLYKPTHSRTSFPLSQTHIHLDTSHLPLPLPAFRPFRPAGLHAAVWPCRCRRDKKVLKRPRPLSSLHPHSLSSSLWRNGESLGLGEAVGPLSLPLTTGRAVAVASVWGKQVAFTRRKVAFLATFKKHLSTAIILLFILALIC